jgi:hypothetical protein
VFSVSGAALGSDVTGFTLGTPSYADPFTTSATGTLSVVGSHPSSEYQLLSFQLTALSNAPTGASELILDTGTSVTVNGNNPLLWPTPGPVYNSGKDLIITVEGSGAPEPSGLALMLAGACLLGGVRLRQARARR